MNSEKEEVIMGMGYVVYTDRFDRTTTRQAMLPDGVDSITKAMKHAAWAFLHDGARKVEIRFERVS